MKCEKCGELIEATDHFCLNCGTPIVATPVIKEESAAPIVPTARVDAAEVSNDTIKVDKKEPVMAKSNTGLILLFIATIFVLVGLITFLVLNH